jgi:hypothetical protein
VPARLAAGFVPAGDHIRAFTPVFDGLWVAPTNEPIPSTLLDAND